MSATPEPAIRLPDPAKLAHLAERAFRHATGEGTAMTRAEREAFGRELDYLLREKQR